MMPAWLSYGPIDWTLTRADLPSWGGMFWTDDYTDLPTVGLSKPQRWEPPPAAPVAPRPIPRNLPESRGDGLVWGSVVDQIEAYDDGRTDPPGPVDSNDRLGRTA